MGTPRLPMNLRNKLARQITERGYSVADVLERLGVSTHFFINGSVQ